MDFRDTLSALLPPPRDDEPASLRQDILDELGDHLASAYNRELLRGVDSTVARQRVLERFGDPAAVARRLWFDAMKGKIMAQRVLIATCLVVMAACGMSAALAWRWINQDQLMRARTAAESIAANQRMSEALAQAQATNQNMLNKLSEMSEAIRHPRSPDWNPVSFKLTEETPSGPPVEKANLALIRSGENPPKTIERISDASGIADFGAIQPGDYSFSIHRAFRKGYQSTSGQLNVQPGSENHKSIVCPRVPPEKVPVQIKCALPPDLETQGLFIYAPFTFSQRTLDPGLPWNLEEIGAPQIPKGINGIGGGLQGIGGGLQYHSVTRSVFCGAGGWPSTEIVNSGGLHLWKTEHSERVFGDILESELREPLPSEQKVRWEPGTYRLAELMVVRPGRGQDVEKGRRRLDIIARSCPPGSGHAVSVEPPHEGVIPMIYSQIAGPGYGQQQASKDLILKDYWPEDLDHFEARPGQVNEWTIDLPEELIKAVREKLEDRAAAKPNPIAPAAATNGR
jgi:hypothetical protein